MTRVSPAKAWDEMLRGNERFTSGQPAHPRQDIERLSELQDTQTPSVALFGCSDSRLAAEIIFDKGLGDLFVIPPEGRGNPWWHETKRLGGKLTPEQVQFRERNFRAGMTVVVGGVKEAKAHLSTLGYWFP